MTANPKIVNKNAVKFNESAIASGAGEDRPSPYSMTEEVLLQRARKVNRGRYKTQLFAGITACVSSLSYGQVLGWCYPALRKKYDTELLNKTVQDKAAVHIEANWDNIHINFQQTASFIPLGCFFGNLVLSYLAMRKGPRIVMLILCPLLVLGWLLLALIHEADFSAMAMLWLAFVSVGFKVCAETFLRDTVHAGNLYHLFVLFRSALYLGVWMGYVFGSLYNTVAAYSGTSSLICVFQFIMICFCKESPVFTFKKHPMKALRALEWYRGAGNTYTEMRFIKKDSDARNTNTATKYMLLKRVVYKALLIVAGLTFFEVCTGFYPILLYCYAVWGSQKDTKLTVVSQFWDACILGMTYYLSSLIFGFVNYKVPFGVRKPLIVTSILIFLILSALTAYVYMVSYEINEYYNGQQQKMFFKHNDWIRLLLTCLFIVSYQAGYSTYPDIILTDYLPYQVLPVCKLGMRSLRYGLNYILIRFFINLQRSIRGPGHLYFLCVVNFIGIFYVSFMVIESKGRSLLQLQILFGGNPVGARSAFRMYE